MEIDSFSAIMALEIYVNPKDLFIAIGKEEGEDVYTLSIARGPNGNCKILLNPERIFERDEAIQEIEEILHEACKIGEQVLDVFSAETAKKLKIDDRSIKEMDVLTEKDINEIVDQLKSTGMAATYREK